MRLRQTNNNLHSPSSPYLFLSINSILSGHDMSMFTVFTESVQLGRSLTLSWTSWSLRCDNLNGDDEPVRTSLFFFALWPIRWLISRLRSHVDFTCLEEKNNRSLTKIILNFGKGSWVGRTAAYKAACSRSISQNSCMVSAWALALQSRLDMPKYKY
jgi:hypothetical protein